MEAKSIYNSKLQFGAEKVAARLLTNTNKRLHRIVDQARRCKLSLWRVGAMLMLFDAAAVPAPEHRHLEARSVQPTSRALSRLLAGSCLISLQHLCLHRQPRERERENKLIIFLDYVPPRQNFAIQIWRAAISLIQRARVSISNECHPSETITFHEARLNPIDR